MPDTNVTTELENRFAAAFDAEFAASDENGDPRFKSAVDFGKLFAQGKNVLEAVAKVYSPLSPLVPAQYDNVIKITLAALLAATNAVSNGIAG